MLGIEFGNGKREIGIYIFIWGRTEKRGGGGAGPNHVEDRGVTEGHVVIVRGRFGCKDLNM